MNPDISRRRFIASVSFVTALGLPAILHGKTIAPSPNHQDSIRNITRSGSQPSNKGPADWFTGTVRIDPLFDPIASARAGAATVTFEPDARTAWHTHPFGQRLIVTGGCGQEIEGGPIEEIRQGDVVWFPPGVRHWHGAAPTTLTSDKK